MSDSLKWSDLDEQWWFVSFYISRFKSVDQMVFPRCKFNIDNGNITLVYEREDGTEGNFTAIQGRYMNLCIQPHDPEKWDKVK